jgi:trans-4-hydroxy-L-proline dehydratase
MMNERLAAIRDQAIIRSQESRTSPKEANWTEAFFEKYPDLPLEERQARSFAYALENEPVYCFPRERLVGQIYQIVPGSGAVDVSGSATDDRWDLYAVRPTAAEEVHRLLPENEWYAQYFGDGAGPGHISWDYGPVLDQGVQSMLVRIEELRGGTTDEDKITFYRSVAITLRGLLAWVNRHHDLLKDMMNREADPQRYQELSEMAEICERTPGLPARNFREAVQSFLFQYLAVLFENPHGGNGPGRLDWYLWPFLETDLREGRSTLEEARDLIIELFIKMDERIRDADGWVEAIVVGGRHPDGASSVNPLSYIIVEAIMALKQTHPSVYIRLHDDAPPDFVDLATRYLIESDNRGQIYGDDTIVSTLIADGTAAADARHWGAGGCMEVGVQGMSGDLLFAFAHNLARTFELVLNGGKLLMTGEAILPGMKALGDYQTFEELYEAFEDEVERELSILMRRLDIYLAHYARYRPSFLLSSMVADCLARGHTINDGGARYPHYGGSGLGIPNIGDSLYAVKRVVFDEQRYTGEELLNALRADFKGYEAMRVYLLNLPKYGSGENEEATRMVDRVLHTFSHPLKRHRNPHGGHCRPIILGFVWVVQHGLQVGATPDGRLAGQPLAHGLTPQSGAAINGVTAAITDATSLSLDCASGGGSMMWDIEHFWAEPEFVKPVLLTYMNEGGHIFQGNLTRIEDLIAAQNNPEQYRDLMVRVGGYSARFVTLSPEAQEEIISRYRYGGAPTHSGVPGHHGQSLSLEKEERLS